MKRSAVFAMVAAVCGVAVRADFSFIQTTRQGSTVVTTKEYFKGQKLRIENGGVTTILNMATRTVTLIHNSTRTFVTSKMDPPDAAPARTLDAVRTKMDVRETSEHKTVGGYDARKVAVNLDVDQTGSSTPVKAHIECELWMANVPGYAAMRGLQQKAGNLLGGISPAAPTGLSVAELRRILEKMGGVPVLQIVRIQTPASKVPIEVSTEMSDFSSAVLPASLFVPPQGYRDLGKPAP
jgi:hypothetical protein